MSILGFTASTDLVGGRIRVQWDYDLSQVDPETPPAIAIYRKERDFDFGSAPPPAGFLVYDSTAFPPPGATLTALPGWSQPDGEDRVVTTIESITVDVAGVPFETLRRMSETRLDPFDRVIGLRVILIDAGPGSSSLAGISGSLVPGTVYAYQIESPAIPTPTDPRTTRALAAPIVSHGSANTLYRMLPEVYRQHDETYGPPVASSGAVPELGRAAGQLRRFLDPMGNVLDFARSRADGLRSLRDVRNVDPRLLPLLAGWIGWDTARAEPIPIQRSEVEHASKMFEMVGTLPGAVLWASKLTGWNTRVKEYVHNVFRTNAPEPPKLWEIWERTHNGADWNTSTRVTVNREFDGGPAPAEDGAGDVWVAFPSNRGRRMEVWLQRLPTDPAPFRASEGAPDDDADDDFVDEDASLLQRGAEQWLFFSSNRSGTWDLWLRTFSGTPGNAAVRLTDGAGADRRPVAVERAGVVWLFWQSNRRGPTEIWSQRLTGSTWSEPEPVTQSSTRDEQPSAVVDGAGDIHLYFSRDVVDRYDIMEQRFDGTSWSLPAPVSPDPGLHRAPSVTLFGGQRWLFWHELRSHVGLLWGRVHNGATWEAPFEAGDHGGYSMKDPHPVETGGVLRLFFRSQRSVEQLQSRTIDTDDLPLLGELGTFDDASHYTWDTGLDNDDRYAPNAVGLFLTPDTVDPVVREQRIERLVNFVEPFLPMSTRFTWTLE